MGTSAEMSTGSVSYGVLKAGTNALTCILAAELAPDGVLVNAACPWKIDTRLGVRQSRPIPDDAAEIFAWLATLPDGGPTGQLFHSRKTVPW